MLGCLEDLCCLAALLSLFSWRYLRKGCFGGHCYWEGKGDLGEEGKYNHHGGPHWSCFAQGCVVEQVLGLVMTVYVVPDGSGGDRELASILMLYRDASRAVNKEVGHPVLIPAGVLKRYMRHEGVGELEYTSP